MTVITDSEREKIITEEKENNYGGGSPYLLSYLRKDNEVAIIDKYDKMVFYSNDGTLKGIYQKESLGEFQNKIDLLLADEWERYLFGIDKLYG